MTPVAEEVVGAVAVEVVATAARLARNIRKEVESAFKDLDVNKLLADAVGKSKLKVPVEFDTSGNKPGKTDLPEPDKTSKTQKPVKVPVEIDPLMAAFQQEIKRQTAALAKQANIVLPVSADTAGLREQLGAQLKAVAAQLKVPVGTEPGDKTKYQADLKAQLDEVARQVKAHVPVEPDVDTSAIGEKIRQTKVPKVPVELDPITAAFQASVRSTVASLSRDALKIPVDADSGRLRAELGAELASIQAQAKITVPTEPGAKAEYEAKLRAQLAEVGERVKQSVKIEPKIDKNPLSGLNSLVPNIAGIGTIGQAIQALSTIIASFAGEAAQGGGQLAESISAAAGPIGTIGQGIQGLGTSIASFAAEAAQGGSQLAGSISAAAGPIGTIISLLVSAGIVMGGLGVAAILVVPAITAVAGAAAAIPAALSGAGAVFGTLALGFKGISEAFKPKKSGGGGGGGGSDPAAQARQIAAAERGVESARRGVTAAARGEAAAERGLESARRGLADAEQNVADAEKKSVQAQLAVNTARKDAAEDIDDLGRSLRGAQLDEEGAALAVTDALRALNEAKLTGNIPDIQKADIAYRQAQLTLENATDSAQDLGDQQADAAKKGVEGSDKVVTALDAQQQAQEGVASAQEGVLAAQNAIISAQDGLASAQDAQKSAADGLTAANESLAAAQTKTGASAGGAGAALVKLAPAAQKFVDAVKALKPAFEGLRLDVQQRLFEGLDKTVTNLGAAWIPALRNTLGNYADTFNEFFKKLGAGISTPQFVADIQIGAEGARQGLAAIGTSITRDLVPAFGTLSRAAGPFLAALGQEIADVVTDFSNWVQQGDRTQRLQFFFSEAAAALHDIFTTGRLVTAIIGDVLSIITGAQPGGASSIDSFNTALQKINVFLKDPNNQAQIRNMITDIGNAVVDFGHLAVTVNNTLDQIGLGGSQKGESAGSKIGHAIISGLIAGAIEAMKTSLITFLEYFSPFGPLIMGIKTALGIKSPSTVMAAIGRDLITGLFNGMQSLFGTLSARAAQLRTVVLNAVATAGSWLVNTGRNTVIGLVNGIGSLYGTVSSRAAGLRTTVINALSNAGNWLYNAGHNLIVGLINGISSMIGTLGSYLGQVGSFIQAHKGPPSKDLVLLRPAGQLIMQGLIGGIDDKKAALAAQLADVSSLVAGTNMPALASDLGSVVGSLTSSAGLEIGIAPGTTGDWLMDGLRRNILVKYRGNAVAALSTA